MRSIRCLLAVLALGAVASALPFVVAAGAQEAPGAAPEASFVEEVAVELIEVEVIVTDRRGRSVAGLGREDFALRVDGRPVEITHFSAPGAREAAATAGTAATASGAGEPAAALPAAPSAIEPPLVTVYLDLEHIDRAARSRLLPELADFVERELPAGSGVVVLGQEKGLRVVQPLTRDLLVAASAIRGVAASKELGIDRRLERQRAMRAIQTTYETFGAPSSGVAAGILQPCDEGWDPMKRIVRDYSRQRALRVGRTLEGLATVTGALAGAPGRRVLLYAGEGLERQPGVDLVHYLFDICPENRPKEALSLTPPDLTAALQAVTASANANGVTFYTFETAGLAADVTADEGFGSPIGPGGGAIFRPSTQVLRLERANRQSGLFVLAQETGGAAALDANRFAAPLAEVIDDLASAYVLAFVPPGPPDGRDHFVDVEVDARGVHEVRHRKVYRAKPPEVRLEERLYGALVFGREENPFDAGLAVAAPTPGEAAAPETQAAPAAGLVRLPIAIEMPLARLSLVATGAGTSTGRVRLVMTARDAEGRWLPARQKIVPITVTGSPAEADGDEAVHRFVVEIDLAPGEHLVAVAVRDELSGEEAYLRQTVIAGAV